MIAETSIKKNKRSLINNAAFSILIPSWNNLSYLKLCIESIHKNSQFAHQIIVHINEGTDGTLAWIESQPDIDYTFSEKNIGICYALNIASTLAQTDYIMYMNDDMYVCPGWDNALMNEIKSINHNNFFLSSTMIEPLFTNNNCVIVKNFGTTINDFKEEELLKEFSSIQMHDWLGATWPPNIVHKDVWNLVGGYSTEFSPGMSSDPDFSMKLWKLGIRLYKGVSASRVYHFGCKSTERIIKNDGSKMFFKKWQMPSSTLTKYYLRRGQIFDGALKEPNLPSMLFFKNFFKKLKALFSN
jgi:glycosyltransferase involved in cell wall biosynthesis